MTSTGPRRQPNQQGSQRGRHGDRAPRGQVSDLALPTQLPGIVLGAPSRLTPRDAGRLSQWSSRQWDTSPELWTEQQLTRLALASILEARLLHLKRHRLEVFDKVRHPDDVTLGQLAVLGRSHDGLTGQAFELAVIDACNHQVPEVTGPLRQAMALLGHRWDGPVRMMACGLEKLPEEARPAAAQQMVDGLGRAGLRTGSPGRPLAPTTYVPRMLAPRSLRALGPVTGPFAMEAAHYSQLPRADALLYTDRAAFGVSVKVNPRDAHRSPPWRDVPIWVTRSPNVQSEGSAVISDQPGPPKVIVRVADGRWTRCFDHAMDLIDDLLMAWEEPQASRSPLSDTHERVMLSRMSPLLYQLKRRRAMTIAELTHELRQVHPGVRDQWQERLTAAPGTAQVPVTAVNEALQAFSAAALSGEVFTGQQHLFFRAGPPD